MTGLELLDTLLPGPARGERFHGVAVGIVTNNQDPDGLGRVKVRFPWLSDEDESNWARVVAPMAGPERGMYFLPEVEDEVLVVFEHGLLDHPFVLGALWNGRDKPPARNDDGHNNLRVFKSRSGHTLTFDDTQGKEKITIADSTGGNTIVIDSGGSSITLTSKGALSLRAQGDLSLESSGGEVSIKGQSLSIEAERTFSLKAGQDGAVRAQSGLSLGCPAGVDINDGALEVR